MSSWEWVNCPVCLQPKGSKCRTLKTGRVTDTHIARIEAAHKAKRAFWTGVSGE